MLVLSRKASERIRIGDNVTIEVRRIAGNRVTLAIEAPRDVRILRGELEEAATDFEVGQPATAEYVVSHHRVPITTDLPASPSTTSVIG